MAPIGVSLFSKLAFRALPISEKVCAFVALALHSLAAIDFAGEPTRTAAVFGRGSDTAARTAARIARLVKEHTSLGVCGWISSAPEARSGKL